MFDLLVMAKIQVDSAENRELRDATAKRHAADLYQQVYQQGLHPRSDEVKEAAKSIQKIMGENPAVHQYDLAILSLIINRNGNGNGNGSHTTATLKAEAAIMIHTQQIIDSFPSDPHFASKMKMLLNSIGVLVPLHDHEPVSHICQAVLALIQVSTFRKPGIVEDTLIKSTYYQLAIAVFNTIPIPK